MQLNLNSIIHQLTNNAGSSVDKNSQTSNATPSMPNNIQNAQPNTSAGNALLQNMLAGDTFTGKVMSIKDGMALLMLAGGNLVNAHISNGSSVSAGQNLTFLVEQNTQQNISIKPLNINEQQAFLINKALDAAGYSPNDSNIQVVKELIHMNMPIDAAMIEKMITSANEFPQANLKTIANLIRLEMPVTQDNIMQFEAYSNYQNSISSELNSMGEQFSQLFTNIVGSEATVQNGATANNEALADNLVKLQNFNMQQASMLNDIVNTLYQNTAYQDVSYEGGLQEAVLSQPLHQVLSDEQMQTIESTIHQLLSESPENEQLQTISNALGEKSLTTNQLLSNLTLLLKNNPEWASKFSAFGEASIMEKLFSQMINETMKLTPADVVKEDGIKNYYKRLKQSLEKLTSDGRDSALPQELSKSMNEVKANIDFMNDLNKNMTYVQIPIQLKNSETNGELYVFTNKKALAKGADNVSAMLHLDMEHLGPIDIYVRLQNKNVSTNFCLESEELLDFVYAHIDKLDARLQALGYSTSFEMKLNEPEDKFNFVEDFVEKDISKNSTSQFILDIRA
ncbi:MAG: flagellar hook-length control protein FliK [Lachnospira sp.]|nr:flagellar hook-length control protein FliK [Lachnospira sp.]